MQWIQQISALGINCGVDKYRMNCKSWRKAEGLMTSLGTNSTDGAVLCEDGKREESELALSIPAGIIYLLREKSNYRMRMGKGSAFSFRLLKIQGSRMVQEGQLRATTGVRLKFGRQMGPEPRRTWFS